MKNEFEKGMKETKVVEGHKGRKSIFYKIKQKPSKV